MTNGKVDKRRILCAGLLLMMAVLAVATIAFAQERAGDSYTMLLRKEFEIEVPEKAPDGHTYTEAEREQLRQKVLEQAKKRSYDFRVEAIVKENGALKQVVKDLTLPFTGSSDNAITGLDGNEWGAKIKFGGAAIVSVVELTDHIENADGALKNWNLAGNKVESTTKVPEQNDFGSGSGTSLLSIGKPNGKIRIEKDVHPISGQPNTYSFHLCWKGGGEDAPGVIPITVTTFSPPETGRLSQDGTGTDHKTETVEVDLAKGYSFPIASGGAVEVSGLPVGQYQIEELKTDEGYSFVVDNPNIVMSSGADGSVADHMVNINGQGSVTITPPDDGHSHHYTVTKKDDSSFREDVTVAPGGLFRENIAPGQYIINEKLSEGVPGFQLLASSVVNGSRTYTTGLTKNKTVIPTTEIIPENGDCARIGVSAIKGVAAGNTANFRIKALWQGEAAQRERSVHIKAYSDNTQGVMNAPYMVSQKFTIRTTNTKVAGYTVNYRIKKHKEASSQANDAGIHSQTIEVRNGDFSNNADTGELVIRKPADTTGLPRADEVAYNYTVTGPGGYKKALGLKAGEELRLTGLTAGNYTVTETIDAPERNDFVVTVHDESQTFKPNIEGTGVKAFLRDQGTMVISKPAYQPDSTVTGAQKPVSRKYFFHVVGEDSNTGDKIYEYDFPLLAGQKITFTSQQQSRTGISLVVPPGVYTVTAIGDTNSGYKLSYGDSRTLAVVTATDQAEVVVTNNYSMQVGGYHVIHEYYADEDFTKEPEVKSTVSSVRGLHLDGKEHTADEVGKIEIAPNGKVYQYRASAYGIVTPGTKAASPFRGAWLDSGIAASAPAAGRGPVLDSGVAAAAAVPRVDNTAWIDGANCTYAPDGSMNGVTATEDGSQIIILRYVPEKAIEEIPLMGSYKVVHEYYLRTDKGDTYEGHAGIESIDEQVLGSRHTREDFDEARLTFTATQGDEVGKSHRYAYENVLYGMAKGENYYPDATMSYATATKGGNEIIILRYVRMVGGSTVPPGSGDAEGGNPPDQPDPGPGEPEEPDKPDEPDAPDTPDNPDAPPDTPEEPGPPVMEEPGEEEPEEPGPGPQPDDDDDDDDDDPPVPPPGSAQPPAPGVPDTGDGSRTELWTMLSVMFLTGLLWYAAKKRDSRQ